MGDSFRGYPEGLEGVGGVPQQVRAHLCQGVARQDRASAKCAASRVGCRAFRLRLFQLHLRRPIPSPLARTDLEGVLFQPYFSKLNPNGLFDTNEEALDYLRYYLSFDWTERSENFTSIEVYALPNTIA